MPASTLGMKIAACSMSFALVSGTPATAQNMNEGPLLAPRANDYLGSASLWAIVNSNGTLAARDGAQSSSRLALGQYQVIFSRNVRRPNCSYVATLSGATAAPPGEITVAQRATDVRGVFVTTHTSSGAFADRGFDLHVVC